MRNNTVIEDGVVVLKRRLFLVVSLALALTIGFFCVDLATPQRDYFLGRSGELIHQERIESSSGVGESVRLGSSTGLQVDLRVRRPAQPNARLPVLVLLGGHRTGKNAVDLVGHSDDIAYVALDYPYNGGRSLRGIWQFAGAVPDFQRAFLDTPPSLSLVVDWLASQDWVDTDRIELLGISLGVPFAAVAGALDERYSRVWLVHGGADNMSWVMHAGRDAIDNESLRRLVASSLLFLVYGRSFQTERWIQEISPRPLIVIAARDDERVPVAAQQPFVDAAGRGTAELIWTTGMHVDPGRPDVLRQLLDIVLHRVSNDR